MQNYMFDGILVAETISTKDVEPGTVCIVSIFDSYFRVTIIAVKKNGNLIVVGDYNGEIYKDRSLYKLMIIGDNKTVPFQIEDWKKAITQDLINKKITVKVRSKKFKAGEAEKKCNSCSKNFKADKSQNTCENCCNNELIAYLN
jgi:hypothetical protein